MEDKGIAGDAVASAKRWLNSAGRNAGGGDYDTALYSLEMSVEIALKAVLFALGLEVPRMRSISDLATEALKGDSRLPKEFREETDSMVGTFNALINLRPTSGYMFETTSTLTELKKKYEAYKGNAERTVDLCENAVRLLTTSK